MGMGMGRMGSLIKHEIAYTPQDVTAEIELLPWSTHISCT